MPEDAATAVFPGDDELLANTAAKTCTRDGELVCHVAPWHTLADARTCPPTFHNTNAELNMMSTPTENEPLGSHGEQW